MGKHLIELFLVTFKLGCTSFGGPTAHIGYFHKEYVKKQKWLSETEFTELVALSQALPGPASSQVGFGVGMLRAGILGGVISFLGFTVPSFLIMALFVHLIGFFSPVEAGWIHGLKIVAAAVVYLAISSMAKNFASSKLTGTIALIAAIIMLLYPSSFTQLSLIVGAAAAGYAFIKIQGSATPATGFIHVTRKTGWISAVLFLSILLFLPGLSKGVPGLELFSDFYRTGSLVFGGGHVVLPLLDQEVVAGGLVSREEFLAGYGVAQAIPGPLFTFASYLGAAISGWSGAVITTLAIFLPGFLLLVAIIPFWGLIRTKAGVQSAIMGMNAAVVGLLGAAFYDPVLTSSISSSTDAAFLAGAFCLLSFWKLPPWLVVAAGAGIGQIIF
ncbi:chromate efflux transporter [Bacillus sp. EB01]|uniref:chromate efflux transporter n=1 Tax=Bacillus sp. EB01 TaxID=1347086 RepID=UPI001E592907|nr:chromate efflux transporter [Bacillus sp. EB01]